MTQIVSVERRSAERDTGENTRHKVKVTAQHVKVLLRATLSVVFMQDGKKCKNLICRILQIFFYMSMSFFVQQVNSVLSFTTRNTVQTLQYDMLKNNSCGSLFTFISFNIPITTLYFDTICLHKPYISHHMFITAFLKR